MVTWRGSGPCLRWGAWRGDEMVELPVAVSWDVETVSIGDAPELPDAEITAILESGLDRALGTRRFAPDERIAIGVDDLARPTPTSRILPDLLRRLEDAGATPGAVRIIVATGAHRPLTRGDLELKLGSSIVERYAVLNHHPFHHLTDLGVSERGTPIRINTEFASAHWRALVGCVLPHPYMGYGGGAKMVLPGLSGIDSLEANHRSVVRGLAGRVLMLEGNECRADVEDIATTLGIDVSVQAVVDGDRSLVAVEVGDVVESHRAAARVAGDLYRVRETPRGDFDIIFAGAYPKDLEQYQLGNAFNALRSAGRSLLRPGGSFVIVGRCPDGIGYHALQGHGMPLHRSPRRTSAMGEGREIVVYSPGLNVPGLRFSFHEGALLARNDAGLRAILADRHDDRARVLVVPSGPLTILGEPS